MTIYYCFFSNKLTGGLKVQLHHCRILKKYGFDVAQVVPEGSIPWWTDPSFEIISYDELYNRVKRDDWIVLSAIQDYDRVKDLKCRKCYLWQHFIINDYWLVSRKDWLVFTVSYFLKTQFEAVINRKIEVVPNGIDLNVFKPNGQKEPNRTFLLKYGEWKGYCKEAWQPLFSLLKDKLVIKHNLTEQQMVEELQKSDIYIQLTKFEGFGLPLLEAMACGCACVDASVGTDDFSIDGVTSLKVPNTPGSVYSAVLKLLRDPELKEKIREEGYKKAQEYSWDKIEPILVDFWRRHV